MRGTAALWEGAFVLAMVLMVAAPSQRVANARGNDGSVHHLFSQAVLLQRQSHFVESAAMFEKVVTSLSVVAATGEGSSDLGTSASGTSASALLLPSALFNLATAKNQLGRRAEAQHLFEQVVNMHTNSASSSSCLAAQATACAAPSAGVDPPPNARFEADKSTVLLPALRALGILHLTSGTFAAAQHCFQEVLGRAPWDQVTAFNLYSALKEQDKAPAALRMLEFVVRLDPTYELGVVELAEQRMAAAVVGEAAASGSDVRAGTGNTPNALSSTRQLLETVIAASDVAQLGGGSDSSPSPTGQVATRGLQARLTLTQLLLELDDADAAVRAALDVNRHLSAAGLAPDPGSFGLLCVARRLTHDMPGAVAACEKAIDLHTRAGLTSARHSHHVARHGEAHRRAQALEGYWVQLCYARALSALPVQTNPQGTGSQPSRSAAARAFVESAIGACENAARRGTQSLPVAPGDVPARAQRAESGEQHDKAARQRSVNFALMVDSSLAVLYARNGKVAASQAAAERVWEADRRAAQGRTATHTGEQRRLDVLVCSAGGAGTTSLMHAAQEAGLRLNAGAGISFLKHRSQQDAAALAAQLELDVAVVLYTLRDPRDAVVSVFRRQFQFLLSVQLRGCGSFAGAAGLSTTSDRAHRYTACIQLHPAAAEALQSLDAYIAFLAQGQRHGDNQSMWADPLPQWQHLRSWVGGTEGAGAEVAPTLRSTAGAVVPRLVVDRERVLEPAVFGQLCARLGIDAASPRGEAFRGALVRAQPSGRRAATAQDRLSLSPEQHRVLTQHFAPLLTFRQRHLSQTGLFVVAGQPGSEGGPDPVLASWGSLRPGVAAPEQSDARRRSPHSGPAFSSTIDLAAHSDEAQYDYL